MQQWIIGILFVLSLHQSHAFMHSLPSRSSSSRPSPDSLMVRKAEEGGFVDNLFGLFFGQKQERPLGFERSTVKTRPEVYRATTDQFAEPVRGDSREVALLRPLLAQTRIEKKPLVLVYDANKDGWSAGAFHKKVDNGKAALVVAKTRGGALCGGYNPDGWEGAGDERSSIAAFLFTWRDGKAKASRPIKLPKLGNGEYAVDDRPDLAVKFGYEDLLIKLTGRGPDQRKAISKLGLGYAKGPGGFTSLFAPAEGKTAELIDLKVYNAKATTPV